MIDPHSTNYPRRLKVEMVHSVIFQHQDSSPHSYFSFILLSLPCFTFPLHPLFHGSWVERGASGVAQVHCRQRQKSVSEATVTMSIYLQPPTAKTLAVPIQQLIAISFN